MATPVTTIYVKGDPAKNKLLDCPFCHRVLLAYEAKKLPYKMEYIDFDNKPAWLLEASGGKVPVIKEGPDAPYMPDSDVIVVHLEKQHPEPSLQSSVPAEIGAKLFPNFRAILIGPAAEVADKVAALEEQLAGMDDYLRQHEAQGPLFGGQHLNGTDCSLAPKLYHAVVALKHFKGWELPARFTALHKYLAALKALPEWQHVDYGTEAIIAGWERHIKHAAAGTGHH
ncbi:hypothetical protein CHLRE_10g456750v5 [Chlamydomonas reinhardtii]|uniref:GST N-terminal domain-containing protein n=1 Tax=Chlamydomonas reinhardtii TaxID=3055 RepID=A8I0K9_CHLRE|nr:uncharacterized protein CHLRE_10g456750v5 [Chlamydomonas reinhardtii]PNW77915.1 hypothetical protein CHLRE_10g456750v5 [Chlamydomonas reinhardtii]|eukprot:XP_001698375.1 dehydroascorbate reductase [Chlamydomonas reinhardtii]